MPVYRLVAWTHYLEPPERVWALWTEPDHLAEQFPVPFRLDDPDRLRAMLRGEHPPGLVEARIGLAVWPIRVECSEPRRRYVDSSENRLFRRFLHEHRVEPSPGGARYVDRLTFEPAGPAPHLAARTLERLFVHRHKVAARRLRPDRRTLAVTLLRELFPHELDAAWEV